MNRTTGAVLVLPVALQQNEARDYAARASGEGLLQIFDQVPPVSYLQGIGGSPFGSVGIVPVCLPKEDLPASGCSGCEYGWWHICRKDNELKGFLWPNVAGYDRPLA